MGVVPSSESYVYWVKFGILQVKPIIALDGMVNSI